MHSCLGAVKTSMLVVQRAQEAVRAALLARQSGCTLEETLSNLLDCYIHILTDGKIQAIFFRSYFESLCLRFPRASHSLINDVL